MSGHGCLLAVCFLLSLQDKSTVILLSSEVVVDGVVGSEVSVMATTKAFPELDAKEAGVSGAEVMQSPCDSDCVLFSVVGTSGCVKVGVADPGVISSWLLEVLQTALNHFHLDSPTDVVTVLEEEFACEKCGTPSFSSNFHSFD